jgi:PAT family beta-lactamase induction signal transducer AmpG
MASEASPRKPEAAAPSWRTAVSVYLHRRVIAMLFLGFSAGLPFLLIFSTLSAWLREAEVSHAAIGFFSWLGITFSLKVVWAPVVDRLPLPLLTRALGRRRSWMLIAQLGIAIGLLGLAGSEPGQALLPIVAFGLMVAFASATQDIAIDAYRIEAVRRELQGAMAATYQLGYRLALLMAGAGALYIAEGWSWSAA